MTKPKGLNPAVGKDMVQCPVPGCSKTNIRRDNWQNHMKNKVICEGKKPVSISSALFKNANKDKRDHTRFFIDGGFSLDNLPSPVVIEEQIKVTKSKDISKMFQQPTARSGAGETPSVVRHEKSPELPEDPGVVGRISHLGEFCHHHHHPQAVKPAKQLHITVKYAERMSATFQPVLLNI